jgi:RES domain-containing protein
MCHEYQGTILLLPVSSNLSSSSVSLTYIYLRLIPLVYQAAQQAFRMINNVRRRLSESGGSIVTEGHDTSIGNLLGKEVFQPKTHPISDASRCRSSRRRVRARPRYQSQTEMSEMVPASGINPVSWTVLTRLQMRLWHPSTDTQLTTPFKADKLIRLCADFTVQQSTALRSWR